MSKRNPVWHYSNTTTQYTVEVKHRKEHSEDRSHADSPSLTLSPGERRGESELFRVWEVLADVTKHAAGKLPEQCAMNSSRPMALTNFLMSLNSEPL